ncbi:hypothetical protein MSG28_000985 [Choristoneura fumiferana]|uniref:Uncharacterized protein n=1 Tax=Choristoneura fumiferana TaxID=7141 RepID=A0ACC0K3J2_CHOFU|nr:hypothetical protein MSG28_000985 [Choristoneura fumiferana]
MASSFNVQIKMENLCRTCLSKETILHSVFDVYSESIKFDYVLNAVTGLKILADGVKVENSVADDNDDGLEIDFSLSASPENYKDWSNNVECEDEHGTYCPLCGTCHENADNLTKHMWTNHAELMGPKKRGRPKKLLTSENINVPEVCSICSEVFLSEEDLVTHNDAEHPELSQRCNLCSKENKLSFAEQAYPSPNHYTGTTRAVNVFDAGISKSFAVSSPYSNPPIVSLVATSCRAICAYIPATNPTSALIVKRRFRRATTSLSTYDGIPVTNLTSVKYAEIDLFRGLHYTIIDVRTGTSQRPRPIHTQMFKGYHILLLHLTVKI